MPAYRELYKRSFEGFIDKMAHRDTWSYWEDMSMGMAMGNSNGLPGREMPSADPIARDNINYSANTMNLMAMHQMFYRDDRFLKPDSFLLKHWTKDGLQVFSYNLPKVAQAIFDGFKETGSAGRAVIDPLGDLGRDKARQIRPQTGYQAGGDYRAGGQSVGRRRADNRAAVHVVVLVRGAKKLVLAALTIWVAIGVDGRLCRWSRRSVDRRRCGRNRGR